MKEQSVSKIYAQSLLELGTERGEKVVEGFIGLTEVINKANMLENVLFLDVFTQDEKKSVFGEVAKKLNLSPLLTSMVNYLIDEKRIGLLPLIVKELVVLDDEKKGFLRGTIEGAEDRLDDNITKQMTQFLRARLGKEPVLNYVKNPNISAGYRVTVEDLQMDASLDYQLEKFKQSVISE
jgi:F-type H+-transporting ATPase subunit delta